MTVAVAGRAVRHEPVEEPFDGRRACVVDAGLSMLELAEIMVGLGAESAINLDGGGSTTLVHRRHLLNRPYSSQDQPAPQTRRVVTALAFEPAP